ncbi:MAG: hypothetical protein SFU86_04305 [Pirellulaceae bacterium]|nr:hypothetical protein [Pirellulaceae bacterium]
MKSLRKLLVAATLLGAVLAIAPSTWAGGPHHGHKANRADRIARYYAAQRPWHGNYSYTPWGTPVALVVPPTAKMHTSYAWGVSQSEMVPIYHQFFRDYPGPAADGSGAGFQPTPYWPSHTDQFGVYPVRGPW